MRSEKSRSRCSGRTKRGEPCKAAATPGGLCFFHANPKKASELGRIGGRSKQHAGNPTGVTLPEIQTATAAKEALARLATAVMAGEVEPRIATCLRHLINQQLRTIPVADLEQRLTKVEMYLAALPDPDKQRAQEAEDRTRSELSARMAAGRARVEAMKEPSGSPLFSAKNATATSVSHLGVRLK
jgi:hypothetical protein